MGCLATGAVDVGAGVGARVIFRDGAVQEGELEFNVAGEMVLRRAGAAGVVVPPGRLERVVFSAPARLEAPVIELRAGQGMAPWQLANVGRFANPARLTEGQSDWTLNSVPGEPRYSSDDFHFLHHPLAGDGELVVQLSNPADKRDSSRAGIGFFESVADRSRQVRLVMSQKKGGGLGVSSKAGKTVRTRRTVRTLVPPMWLKLERRGDEFVASASEDGRKWEVVATETVELPKNLLAGLVVATSKGAPEYAARFAGLRLTQRSVGEGVYPQVTLASGSVLAGVMESADGVRLALRFGDALRSLPMAGVSSVAFDWVRPDLAARLRTGRPGVLLPTGDFLDGEVRVPGGGRVTVSSVLFGLREYAAPGGVLALATGKPEAPVAAGAWMVRLRDGSIVMTRSLTGRERRLTIEEPVAGRLDVNLKTVAEIYRQGPGQ